MEKKKLAQMMNDSPSCAPLSKYSPLSVVIHDSSNWTGNEEYSLLNDLKVAYFALHDVYRNFSYCYITSVFDRSKLLTYRIDNNTIVSRREPFSILVVSGNDTERIVRFIRTNLPILNSVPKICITYSIGPKDRAKLLNAGFDDVITAKNIGIAESQARIGMIHNRYLKNIDDYEIQEKLRKGKISICNFDSLSNGQKFIFDKLFNSFGRTVAFDRLLSTSSLDDAPTTITSLRVQIGNVRKQLKSNFIIENVRDEGYCLDHIRKSSISNWLS